VATPAHAHASHMTAGAAWSSPAALVLFSRGALPISSGSFGD
jgi:hypothetical protein